ncbi:hypothetical protein CDL12_14278 [Handroanthus impetiginosus]|uniref:Uncharacterized protein n=1 Tax=Handroanthus impetiginosus TaxID=429701 RepID=A0A2G9H6F8_9LAMI|nr:hypothetical protein CDL12_14278 [Handroanthus impetiginosus]
MVSSGSITWAHRMVKVERVDGLNYVPIRLVKKDVVLGMFRGFSLTIIVNWLL